MQYSLPALMLILATTILAACSGNDAEKAEGRAFTSLDTTVQSRDVAVPVTLVMPELGEGETAPVVLMAHGHGGSRDEAGGFRLTAEALARRGIASVRMDFSGCGDSSEPFTENSPSNMLLDLRAVREFAASRDGIDKDRIGLLGFSMGARLVAMLSALDRGYKAMVTWAPEVGDNAQWQISHFGGAQAYYDLKRTAQETGAAEYTTPWATQLELGYRWFTDMEQSRPLEALAKFTGPVLIVSADEDEVVTQATVEAAAAALTSSEEVVRLAIPGVGHGLGFYADEPKIAARVVEASVDFFAERL